MASKSFKITFDGYWREPNKASIPSKSGIYCVYSCVHNVAEKTVSLKKLIYVGEADDVNSRVAHHDKLEDFKKHVKQGEILCYSFGGVAAPDRVRCEAALIYKHKPPVNTEYTNAFPFDETSLEISGRTSNLQDKFTVQRKN